MNINPIHSAPYTNFHDLNLDWIIEVLNEFNTKLTNFVSLATIKYADPIQWDITSQYEANTVVVDSKGNAYLSVQPVPSGVSLDRVEFWTKIGNFDELWADVKKAITPNDEGHSPTATAARAVNDLVWVNGALVRVTRAMIAGDAYVPGSNCVSSSTNEVLHYLITALNEGLSAEKQAREDADRNLQTAIDTEKQAREDAINDLKKSTVDLEVFTTPEMYGAKGDGSTDDTAAIRAAFNAANANKPIILTGQYYCTGTITVKRDTTVIGAASRPRAVLIPYFIFSNAVNPAFSIVGAQDSDVDYGGTLENVTFKGVTVGLKNPATSASVAFKVQWARFFTLEDCSVHGFTTAVDFANNNGMLIKNFEYSTNGSVNVTVFNKFNTGGNTGLKLQHIVINNFSEGISKAVVLYDTTANSQAGDRWFEDWLCVGPWNNVIYYTHGNGFSRHVYINRIFADHLIDNLVYLVGSGANEDAQITDIGCVGVGATYRGILVTNYCRLTINGVAGSSAISTYDFISLNNAMDVVLTNAILDGPSTYFIAITGGARIAVCNTRNTQTGNINVTGDASYCQWCNVSTVGTNNLLVNTGSNNQATNVQPTSTN
nr:MAG TPA: Pectate lyase [Caudoviricetes sp.]